jgi:hypothetical protein
MFPFNKVSMLAADPKGTTCALAPKAVKLNKESNSFFILNIF